MGVHDDIRFFFDDPQHDPQPLRRPMAGNATQLSVLYLLRREAQDCLIGDVIDERLVLEQAARHRLFATAMVVFAGIDLLGKFTAGCNNDGTFEGGVGDRFKAFVTTYVSLSSREADALYAVRNGLVHSFGLYDDKRKLKVGVGIDPSPVTTVQPIIRTLQGQEVVFVDHLYRGFTQGIHSYHTRLTRDASLQAAFASAFGYYGSIAMGVH